MAKNNGMRPIRIDQFEQQLEEAGVGSLQEIMLSKTDSVFIRLGNAMDQDDFDEFMARVRGASTSEETAMVVLDYYPTSNDPDEYEPGDRGEAQWEKYAAAGKTADTLAALWGAATADQSERLGKLRPKRS